MVLREKRRHRRQTATQNQTIELHALGHVQHFTGHEKLPLNAGVAGSSYGTQIENDFGDPSYDGPCPPATIPPFAHLYFFTVYALDIMLPELPTHGEFAPGAEALYHALIAAPGHILQSASLRTHYSAAN